LGAQQVQKPDAAGFKTSSRGTRVRALTDTATVAACDTSDPNTADNSATVVAHVV
jgi:hypothetical protein